MWRHRRASRRPPPRTAAAIIEDRLAVEEEHSDCLPRSLVGRLPFGDDLGRPLERLRLDRTEVCLQLGEPLADRSQVAKSRQIRTFPRASIGVFGVVVSDTSGRPESDVSPGGQPLDFDAERPVGLEGPAVTGRENEVVLRGGRADKGVVDRAPGQVEARQPAEERSRRLT